MSALRVAAAPALSLLALPAPVATRPAVAIFPADGQHHIDAPSLDRLARERVERSRFCTTPIGSPTPLVLDGQHGEAGRLLYDCDPYDRACGGLCED